MRKLATTGMLLGLALLLCAAAPAASVPVTEGPLLLRDNVAFQWGGHTVSYMVVGERFVFWAAKDPNADTVTSTVYVGQYPKAGVDEPPALTALQVQEPIDRISQPQLLRTAPHTYGLYSTGYVSVPSPLVGSVCDYRDLYVMTHCARWDRPEGQPDPCALLLYRLEVEPDRPKGES